MEKPDILGMTKTEIREWAKSIGEAAYRGEQLYGWLMRGMMPDEMTNLPKAFRDKFADECQWRMPQIVRRLESAHDGTVKYLMKMYDGECIESVFMKYEHGNTACVSCQAGCRMGCRFCASTKKGKNRDLSASEILGQVIQIGRDTGERVGGIVMMGIGEPLDNYDNTVRFLHLVSDEGGLNVGLRHISVSTCGLVPNIRRLAHEGLPVTLSVSLHSPDDAKRSELMPVNRKYGIDELLDACRYYFDVTGRRVSFEYTLINGENSSDDDARALADRLKKGVGSLCHVNLIVLNRVENSPFSSSDRRAARHFAEMLGKYGINATVRRSLGADINAACGQLRLNEM